MEREIRRYSEVFKRQVIEELGRGKFSSAFEAQQAYGILGDRTIHRWVKKYGREDLFPKRIRIESMKERDKMKEARNRIKDLETALTDAHIDNCLEHAFLEIACEQIGISVEDLKKNNALTLSDARKMRGLK
ncbi:MAG: transposase [Acidobacteriota bacterium]